MVISQIQFPGRVVDMPVVIVMCCTRVLTGCVCQQSVQFNEVCVTEGVVGESPLCLVILVRQALTQSL